MSTANIAQLIDYNYWANKRILEQSAKLSIEQFGAPQAAGFSPGTFHMTLVHTMRAEWLLRERLQHGQSPTTLFKPDDFPTLDAIVARWQDEERQMRAYVGGLTDADLAKVLRFKTVAGVERANLVVDVIYHFVLHGMQHRSECAVMLTNFGFSPGNIDYMFYLPQAV